MPSGPEGNASEAKSSGPPVPLDVAIFDERVRALYQKAAFAIPTNFAGAVVLIGVLWGVFDHARLAAWGAAIAAISVARLGVVLVHARKPRPPDQARRWANLFLLGAVMSGIVWGFSGVLFAEPDILPYRTFVLFLLGGLCAGSTASAVSYLPVFAWFNLPTLVPSIVMMLLSSDRTHVAMGGMLAVYGVAMATLARSGAASFEEAVRLRFKAKEAEREIAASLKQKEILLKEVHHRVKNNLQMISSLFNLQAEFITDAEVLEIFRESQARIRAIATVHQRLYQSSDLSQVDVAGYLRALVIDLRRTFTGHDLALDVSVDVEPVAIGIDLAIPCGLAVNELITNSIKHAFPGRRRGAIRITGKRLEGGRLSISVADDGIGVPAGLDLRSAETLGLQLVYMLTKQMKGEVVLHREGGTRFELLVRLDTSNPKAMDAAASDLK